MPSLRELQQHAYRAIVLDDEAAVRVGTLNPARLGVYRNNARETFHKTLSGRPKARRGLARSYSTDFPSRSGDMGAYGAELPTLLEIYYRALPHSGSVGCRAHCARALSRPWVRNGSRRLRVAFGSLTQLGPVTFRRSSASRSSAAIPSLRPQDLLDFLHRQRAQSFGLFAVRDLWDRGGLDCLGLG
jgi:hypothetical protein